MTLFKKFKDFTNEDTNQNWKEKMLKTFKDEHFFSGDENPIGKILDVVFTDVKPNKEEVKKYLMKYLEESVDLSFSEEWNDKHDNVSNVETITPNMEDDNI